jgi:hypothetical protein
LVKTDHTEIGYEENKRMALAYDHLVLLMLNIWVLLPYFVSKMGLIWKEVLRQKGEWKWCGMIFSVRITCQECSSVFGGLGVACCL